MPPMFPELIKRGVMPDVVTDQTSAHESDQRLPSDGMVDRGMGIETQRRYEIGEAAAKASMVNHVEAMLEFNVPGFPRFDYGNNLRQLAIDTA